MTFVSSPADGTDLDGRDRFAPVPPSFSSRQGPKSMDIVTVVNRTTRTVEGTFDGRTIVLAPHAEVPMLANAAEKVKEQNPLMGSEDPADPRSPTFLVGIKEWKDDISPIEQSNAEERFDRSLVDGPGAKAVKMQVGGKRLARVHIALHDDNPVGIETP